MKLFVLLFLLGMTSVWARPVAPLAGTYSNLLYMAAEGDVTGMEMTIIPSGSEGNYTYHALIQMAEGEPGVPQLVPVTFNAPMVTITFEYPGAGTVRFDGRLTGSALVGNLTGAQFGSTKYVLPRKAGFWQPTAPRK